MTHFNRHVDVRRAGFATSLVAYATGQPFDQLLSQSRGSADVSFARQVAMYLTYVRCGMSLSRVAFAFGRDRSTVAHACHQIEDRRDDIKFDQWVETLEDAIGTAMQLPVSEKVLPNAECAEHVQAD